MRSTTRGLQACLFVLPLLALGCDGGRTPTEPIDEPQPKAAAVAATAEGQSAPATVDTGDGSGEGVRPGAARLAAVRAAQGARPAGVDVAPPVDPSGAITESARGGRGGGNGNGNGNGGGNGGGNGNGNGGNGGGNGGNGGGRGGRGGELALNINPDTWNTNWTHSQGTVQAFVRGGDVGKIDTGSVELVAESGDALAPIRVRVAGGQLVATFSKADAFELLGDDVQSGDRVVLTLRFQVGDEQKELTETVRIVGPDPGTGGGGGGGELAANIQPDTWNTNWSRSAGQVHAFLRGPGLADVDLDTIRLVGDKVDAEPLEPLDVRRVGHQIVARFSKRDAFATLDDPDAGETHTVKIRFTQAGTEKELSEDVRVVGR